MEWIILITLGAVAIIALVVASTSVRIVPQSYVYVENAWAHTWIPGERPAL